MKVLKNYILLHLLFLLFSFASVCSKAAGEQKLFSIKFCIFYGLYIFVLFIYAVGWQQMLKRYPLVTAYASKAVTIIWGMLWGAVFFKERITFSNLIGTLVIILGIYLVVKSDEA